MCNDIKKQVLDWMEKQPQNVATTADILTLFPKAPLWEMGNIDKSIFYLDDEEMWTVLRKEEK